MLSIILGCDELTEKMLEIAHETIRERNDFIKGLDKTTKKKKSIFKSVKECVTLRDAVFNQFLDARIKFINFKDHFRLKERYKGIFSAFLPYRSHSLIP